MGIDDRRRQLLFALALRSFAYIGGRALVRVWESAIEFTVEERNGYIYVDGWVLKESDLPGCVIE